MQYWAFDSSCCGLADNHSLSMPTKKCTLSRQQKILAVPKCRSQHSLGMRAPWHNCSSDRVWLADHVGSISPAWPAMKRREGLRMAGVPRPDSLLMVAKVGLKSTDSSSKREVAAEAELCELAFLFLIKNSCTFLLRCTFSCSIHRHHLGNLHLHPNQMALSCCSLLGAASTCWSRQPVGC